MRPFRAFGVLTRSTLRRSLHVGLAASCQLAAALPALAGETAEVVINPDGGTVMGDGLRLHLGSAGGIQVVRWGTGQLFYEADTPIEGVGNGYVMAVGTTGEALLCGSGLSSVDELWTEVSQSAVTGAGTAESPYQATTRLSCMGYLVSLNTRYVSPKDFFEVGVVVLPPADSSSFLRFYQIVDTYLIGGDNGAAFWQPDISIPFVVGVEKNGQYGAFIQGNRPWDAFFSGYFFDPYQQIVLGNALQNTLDTDPNTDNGLAVQWDLGTPATAVRWSYRMAFTQVIESNCANGIIEGFEACDDGDSDPGDGCSDICQQEVGYACQGEPSDCRTCFSDADCDDIDDCTVDACALDGCSHTPAAEGAECLGGVCDGAGNCSACTQNAQCDDQNDCTADSCDDQDGCVNVAVDAGETCTGGVCNGDTGAPACVECVANEDCDDDNECSAESCDGNQCAYVSLDAGVPCGDDGVCDGEDVPACVGCLSANECGGSTPFCDPDAQVCVECLFGDHCIDDNECTSDLCVDGACRYNGHPGDSCEGDGVCSSRAPFHCVQCISNAHCPASAPLCLGSGSCVSCLRDSDCTAPGAGHCSPSHSCVPCESNADCEDGNECTRDACSSGECSSVALPEGTACTGGTCSGEDPPICTACKDSDSAAVDDGCDSAAPVCAVGAGAPRCVECEDSKRNSGVDFGCDDAAPYCRAATRTCVQCASDDDCSASRLCSAAGACEVACTQNSDCAGAESPICSTKSGRCVECLATGDCQGTETCDGAGHCTHGDLDQDSVADDEDLDDDNDGIPDTAEYKVSGLSSDSDGNGVLDYQDAQVVDCADSGNDGICDALRPEIDADGDGLPNHLDRDADGDTIPDLTENDGEDSDGDGAWDPWTDENRDGVADEADTQSALVDTDGDREPDCFDVDSDNDGLTDLVEASDTNQDGMANRERRGVDADADGLDAAFDSSEGGRAAPLPDGDRDGTPDWRDEDGAVVSPPSGNGGAGGEGGAATGDTAGDGGGGLAGAAAGDNDDDEDENGCSCRIGQRESRERSGVWFFTAMAFGLLAQRRRHTRLARLQR